MTDTPQPTSGTLEARVIRACTIHKDCALECPERKVLELGKIASFETRTEPHSVSLIDRVKERIHGISRS